MDEAQPSSPLALLVAFRLLLLEKVRRAVVEVSIIIIIIIIISALEEVLLPSPSQILSIKIDEALLRVLKFEQRNVHFPEETQLEEADRILLRMVLLVKKLLLLALFSIKMIEVFQLLNQRMKEIITIIIIGIRMVELLLF